MFISDVNDGYLRDNRIGPSSPPPRLFADIEVRFRVARVLPWWWPRRGSTPRLPPMLINKCVHVAVVYVIVKVSLFVLTAMNDEPIFDANDNSTSFDLNISFTMEPTFPGCDDGVILLVVVMSIPSDRRIREQIRHSWANREEERAKVIFFIGQPGSIDEDDAVALENAANNDVIVANITDHYYNLSVKTLAALLYKQKRCPKARCIAKADADNVLHLPNLLELCTKSVAPSIVGKCDVSTVIRRSFSKWAVPVFVLPMDQYPPYCSTGVYVMVGVETPGKILDAVRKSRFATSSNTRRLSEDVLFTGIFPSMAAIPRVHNTGFSFFARPDDFCQNGIRHVLGFHMDRDKNPEKYWRLLSQLELTPCS